MLAVAAASAALIGCTTASADAPARGYEFRDISDYFAPRVPSGAVRVKQEMDARAAEAAQEAAKEQESAADPEQWEYVDYSGYDESLNNNPAYIGGDGFAQQGVRDYNGTTETWYSSNQAYHHRTGEWIADDEGYYRDSEGYYVVASKDHAEGEVFDTSKGKAKVYDGGCDRGVTDFYTNF